MYRQVVAAAVAACDYELTEDIALGLAAQSRRVRNTIVSLVMFFVIVVGLLLGVPELRAVGERITHADRRLVGVVASYSRAPSMWCCSGWSSGWVVG